MLKKWKGMIFDWELRETRELKENANKRWKRTNDNRKKTLVKGKKEIQTGRKEKEIERGKKKKKTSGKEKENKSLSCIPLDIISVFI